MKLLGLSFGTKLRGGLLSGTNEILVKEALMAAEEMGVEVGFIRMLDLDIKPCKGCTTCAMSLFEGGEGKCVIKDDLAFVDEQVMESDGLIIGAPVYVLGPSGLFKIVADRWGPSHDLVWRIEAKKIAAAKGKAGPDERSFKNRVGGIMCTGGASTPHWLSLGLPLMYLLTFPSGITVVDQMQVLAISQLGSVALHEKVLERARKLGRNVAQAMGKPISEVKWMGDAGTCPVCHSNLLTVTNKNPVECPICGISGKIKVDGDKITVTFSAEEQKRSRLMLAGKLEHWVELRENFKMIGPVMERGGKELPKKLEKYKGYKEITLKKK